MSQSMVEEAPRGRAVPARPPSRREVLAVAVVCGLVLLLLLCVTGRTPIQDGRGHDGQHYAAMAADERCDEPFIPISPYCYRLLTPAVVSLLPGPVVGRFLVFNFFTWWAVLVAWHLLARRTGLDAAPAMFGTLILATCAWGPMNAFYNPCYVDPLMHLFVVVGLNLMLSGSAWFAVLLPISMLQREQAAVILFVSAIIWEVHGTGWSRGKTVRYGLIAATCAAVYVLLRIGITPTGGTSLTPWATAFQVARWLFDDPTYILISCCGIAYALGVPLLGLVILSEARRYAARHRWPEYFLALCALSVFGGSDKARLVFLAAPVVLLAFVHGMRGLAGKRELITVLVGLFMVHLYVQFPPSLMIDGGRLIAPLVDDPDRGTHVASWILASHWPVSLSRVALHLALSLGSAGSILLVMQYEQRRGRILSPAASAG